MIPSSAVFDQSTLARMLEHDPVVQDYQAFFVAAFSREAPAAHHGAGLSPAPG